MYANLNPVLRFLKILRNTSWKPTEIDGIRFNFFVKQRHGTTIGVGNNHIIKIQNDKHKGKALDLDGEADLIKYLNDCNCISAPQLQHRGRIDGKPYLICNRILQRRGLRDVDVLFAFLELKGCGVVHFDLRHHNIGPLPHGNNVFFNGQFCVLIDYDQAVYDANVSQMPFSELFAYLERKYPDHNSDYMPIKNQLDAYNYNKYFNNGKLDLSATSLVTKGETTIGHKGVYHDISENFLYLKGERGLKARLPVLERIHFSGESILDVGCNTGLLTRYMAGRGAKYVEGIEYSKEHSLVGQMINNCEGLKNVRIIHHDLGKEILTSNYDTIMLFSVLHHINGMEFAIRQIRDHCERIIIECRVQEDGYQFKGKWRKTNKWSFSSIDELIAYLECQFKFKFSRNYGAVDRGRRILELIKV